MMAGNTIEDLEVWKKARELRKYVSQVVKQLPSDEKFRLVDQMIRSSRSITANIAEGHGRYHYQENIQFCRQARGSLIELFDHFTCALNEEYINDTGMQEYLQYYENLHRMLNGYISYLVKKKSSS